MHWPYMLAAIAVLLLAGFLLIRHEKQKDRRFNMELREGIAKAYRERMIERGELPDEDESQSKSLHEIIDTKWGKEG